MEQFRYRTAVLVGPWRCSPDEALQDAVRSAQATFDHSVPEGYRWTVAGEIERRRARLAA